MRDKPDANTKLINKFVDNLYKYTRPKYSFFSPFRSIGNFFSYPGINEDFANGLADLLLSGALQPEGIQIIIKKKGLHTNESFKATALEMLTNGLNVEGDNFTEVERNNKTKALQAFERFLSPTNGKNKVLCELGEPEDVVNMFVDNDNIQTGQIKPKDYAHEFQSALSAEASMQTTGNNSTYKEICNNVNRKISKESIFLNKVEEYYPEHRAYRSSISGSIRDRNEFTNRLNDAEGLIQSRKEERKKLADEFIYSRFAQNISIEVVQEVINDEEGTLWQENTPISATLTKTIKEDRAYLKQRIQENLEHRKAFAEIKGAVSNLNVINVIEKAGKFANLLEKYEILRRKKIEKGSKEAQKEQIKVQIISEINSYPGVSFTYENPSISKLAGFIQMNIYARGLTKFPKIEEKYNDNDAITESKLGERFKNIYSFTKAPLQQKPLLKDTLDKLKDFAKNNCNKYPLDMLVVLNEASKDCEGNKLDEAIAKLAKFTIYSRSIKGFKEFEDGVVWEGTLEKVEEQNPKKKLSQDLILQSDEAENKNSQVQKLLFSENFNLSAIKIEKLSRKVDKDQNNEELKNKLARLKELQKAEESKYSLDFKEKAAEVREFLAKATSHDLDVRSKFLELSIKYLESKLNKLELEPLSAQEYEEISNYGKSDKPNKRDEFMEEAKENVGTTALLEAAILKKSKQVEEFKVKTPLTPEGSESKNVAAKNVPESKEWLAIKKAYDKIKNAETKFASIADNKYVTKIQAQREVDALKKGLGKTLNSRVVPDELKELMEEFKAELSDSINDARTFKVKRPDNLSVPRGFDKAEFDKKSDTITDETKKANFDMFAVFVECANFDTLARGK